MVFDQRSWKFQIVPYVHHKWPTDTVHEIELVKARDLGLKFHQTFSYAVVHFGDIPAECVARVVGHDQTDSYESALEVACKRTSSVARKRNGGGRTHSGVVQ